MSIRFMLIGYYSFPFQFLIPNLCIKCFYACEQYLAKREE